ncbi:hypothetical protein JAAARDRAFT_307553 [Jaapia argillacea MUCL 33604]|uniref:Uncharacterized protein n=1 Tax=Jaapia argillacea MUCL 33604 TaxID=933084 RepID=A0A067PYD4_9AGAM|nr:hypothetical protein JAAARDRAFT_307553 [Jaapia argillacea MUCL 33604]
MTTPTPDVVSVSTIPELPSAQQYGLHTKANRLSKFIEWAKSDAAKADNVDLMYISDLMWMKEPGLPSHEFLIVSIAGPQLEQPTYLRIERDAATWFTLYRPHAKSRCKDKVTFAEAFGWGSLLKTGPHPSQSVASVGFLRNDIPLLKLVILLDVISKIAGIYNMWTVNCWWFVGIIWKNIVQLAKDDEMTFVLVLEEELAGLWKEVAGEENMKKWDAKKFGRVQGHVHGACLMRTFGDAKAKGKLDSWSNKVNTAFRKELRATPGAPPSPRRHHTSPSPGMDSTTPIQSTSTTQRSSSSPPRPLSSSVPAPSTSTPTQATTDVDSVSRLRRILSSPSLSLSKSAPALSGPVPAQSRSNATC